MQKTIVLNAGQSSNEQLGFRAQSCVVQNESNSYWYFPNENTFVLPYTVQMVLAPIGESSASIVYQAPTGRLEPQAAAAVGQLVATFTDSIFGPSSGIQDNPVISHGSITKLLTGPSNGVNNALSGTFPVDIEGFDIYFPVHVLGVGFSEAAIICSVPSDTISNTWSYRFTVMFGGGSVIGQPHIHIDRNFPANTSFEIIIITMAAPTSVNMSLVY